MIKRMLSRYYNRADRAFICGLVQAIGGALLLFGMFKLADYYVVAQAHSHAHFGLLCSYGWASWSMQMFAFIGAGLTLFFIHKWREAAKAAAPLDLDEVERLTTDLLHRDKELKRERSRFKQVVELQMEFVNKHTPDGVMTFVNKALYKIMGYDSWAPMEGVNLYDYLSEPDAQRLRVLHKRMTPARPRAVNTHRIRVAGGKLRWVEWHNCGIFDEQGVLCKVLAVGRDVTDRYVVETELKESESRYRSLFNHMIAGCAIHRVVCDQPDPATGQEVPCNYYFVDVNPAFERLFGFTREEAVGRTVLEMMPSTEPSLIDRFAKVAATGRPDHFSCQFADVNKWFEVSVFSNRPTQFAATFLEVAPSSGGHITERRTP